MQKKSFLIIGHTGFIGQNLLKKMKKEKKQLFLISRKILKKNKLKNEFEYDVFNNYEWFKYLKNNMTIFFLAYNNDLYNLEKNKDYLLKIIKFCIHFNEYIIKKKIKINFIFTSTATIYGVTKINQIVNEKFPDKPLSLYDKSKLCFENIFLDYTKRTNLNFISLRLTNIYGYYSHKKQINRGFLNKLINKSINNIQIDIFGNGTNKRSYVYIDDLINAILITAKKIEKLKSKIFLICDNKSYSFNEILNIIGKSLKKKLKIKKMNYPKLIHKIEKRSFNGSNLFFKKKTGWFPKMKFDHGIKTIINESLKDN
tara:strand:+ start:17291 stop:18229 length:939 start_codon:yes stop_codon:yes gene_type:complete